MKLYVLDGGWTGAIIVVANSKEEALEKMKSTFTYKELNERNDEFVISCRIEQHEISEDLVIEAGGD